jgi:DNA-binding NtrC family response regulator
MDRAPLGGLPRILVVDDDRDVRFLFLTILELEGYELREAGSASEAMECLHRERFSLVLTDYAMPGGTGPQLIHAAHEEGLLERTPVVIVTAHPDSRELDGFDVWRKPVDVDQFLRQIRELVGTPERPDSCASETASTAQVEFVLYVTEHSIASLQARRNLEAALEQFDRQQVRITILNPRYDLADAERDCVTLTPALVRRSPKPKVWLLGDLRDADLLIDLIAASGLDSATEPR